MRLYLHIPFCIRKCNYCDFLSFPADEETRKKYVDALIQSIHSASLRYQHDRNNSSDMRSGYSAGEKDSVVNSVFIGGGTPSALEEGEIPRILDAVRERFALAEDAEITIETNPGTLDTEKLYEYRHAGINRLSMGVQSLNDSELYDLGRIHDRRMVYRNICEIRQVGFTNVNLDLMSGIPGQTLASWEQTLDETIEIAPEHISAYSLIVEPGTPFGDYYLKKGQSGSPDQKPCFRKPQWPELPSEEEERAMYDLTCGKLAAAGYPQYEISNYAKPGYACRHNIGYWTGDAYLGLGLGASSYMKSLKFAKDYERYVCTSDMKTFLENPNTFQLTEIVSPREAMQEYMILGLRMTDGVSVSEFEKRFGKTMGEMYAPVLRKYIGMDLMVHEGDRVKLTREGVSVSNRILAEFL